GLALTASDREVLGRLHEERSTRNDSKFFSQTPDHLVRCDFAYVKRFQSDEHAAVVVSSVAACERDDGFDARICHNDVDELLHLLLHRLEGNVLGCLHRAHDSPGILLGKESLGNNDVEINAETG